ncbi:MAG: type I secretion protein, partial [Roseovarius sp.]|nr:type I secretion protein [Roseovarius sp.]
MAPTNIPGIVDGEDTGENMGLGYDDSNPPTDQGGDRITDGDDTIYGNGGDDTIDGAGGDDLIYGGSPQGAEPITITVIESEAAFDNQLFVYTIDPVTGAISNQQLLTPNVKDEIGTTYTYDAPPGAVIGVGIISPEGTFYSSGYGANVGLNSDGLPHTSLISQAPDGAVTMGFEDRFDLGDSDYDDVIVTVDLGTSGTSFDNCHVDYTSDPLAGDDGDDIIDGNTGDDTIFGQGGDDTLSGNEGDDVVDGGTGDDVVDGGPGDDTLTGGEGDDTITGGDGSDVVEDLDGDNVVDTSSDAGVSALPDLGYPGLFPADSDPDDDRDSVTTGAGNDSIVTGDDADTIVSGAGDDTINAGIDADEVYGGRGDDLITLGEGSDYVEAGGGNDTVYGGLGPGYPDQLNITDADTGFPSPDL